MVIASGLVRIAHFILLIHGDKEKKGGAHAKPLRAQREENEKGRWLFPPVIFVEVPGQGILPDPVTEGGVLFQQATLVDFVEANGVNNGRSIGFDVVVQRIFGEEIERQRVYEIRNQWSKGCGVIAVFATVEFERNGDSGKVDAGGGLGGPLGDSVKMIIPV